MSEKKSTVIIVDGDHPPILTDHSDTILESLEKQNIEVHYHCREGFCGACRSKLISGEVDYKTDPLAYIDDDEFLPCCCIALGDIKIKLV
ncbi:class I ribonucleotide reductase maintenance protein YfaE [Aliiglaciecola sp. 3_MG-2023]|uniref:class I ribonucleotide reductase maintenance protein YfaE n=1 Tax=Aliiglaciecola sp. 3_MG-2023 TaxID=3062644 RepID=UPI0026E12368|nr:class I ribonucleotide reductase maintenance protein YfaE [Aliiglaciecola sp. 3_MG-2023]MDO6692644.1 class I ribonucleotide reductase maintenance protein YfaE [Aliiglaciecola sp. 3_MG-2023]